MTICKKAILNLIGCIVSWHLLHSGHKSSIGMWHVITIIVMFYCLYDKYSYWRRKGVRGPMPCPIVGNYGQVLFRMKSESDLMQGIYNDYPDERFIGIYQGFTPVLVLKDPELIRSVLITDNENFQDRYISSAFRKFKKSLFTMSGDVNWRVMRLSMATQFTKIRLGNTIPLILPAVDKYLKYVKYIVENNRDHEIRALTVNYSLQAIIAATLGVQLDTFDKEHDFKKLACRMITLETQIPLRTMEMICPLINIFTEPVGERIANIFGKHILALADIRTTSDGENKPFIDFFNELKSVGKIEKKIMGATVVVPISDDDVVQNAVTFCLAALETVSLNAAYTLYELAQNPSIQEKCYEEVARVYEKYGGQLTMDAIHEMKYLDMVINEALRKYSASVLDRICGTNHRLPGTDLTLNRGVLVYVPIQAIHKDPRYYSDPDKFIPERFLPDNTSKRSKCTYIPFGDGPRFCIGKQLAKLMSVLGSAAIVYNFKLSPSESFTDIISYNVSGRTKTPASGLWLTMLPRES